MRSYALAVAGLLVLATGRYLRAVESPSSFVDELRSAKERAELQVSQTKGGLQHRQLTKRQQVSNLIERPERWGAVDPREIEGLLEGTIR
jgi:hypothetical protein